MIEILRSRDCDRDIEIERLGSPDCKEICEDEDWDSCKGLRSLDCCCVNGSFLSVRRRYGGPRRHDCLAQGLPRLVPSPTYRSALFMFMLLRNQLSCLLDIQKGDLLYQLRQS